MGGKIYIDAKISFVPVLLEISASNTIDIYLQHKMPWVYFAYMLQIQV